MYYECGHKLLILLIHFSTIAVYDAVGSRAQCQPAGTELADAREDWRRDITNEMLMF